METETKTASLPWQPLTFGGASAFARAPVWRLFVVAFVTAVLVAASVVGFFYLAWEPAFRQAISRLPEEGAVRAGKLDWMGPTPTRLCGGKFVSIVVDTTGAGELGQAADVQCELGRTEIRFRSILGFVGLPYPSPWIIQLNRQTLEPWWGAWHPVVAAALAIGTLLGLFGSWGILAAFYALPAQLIAFYSDRQVTAFGAWRLAVASLLPSAMLMAVAILAYSLQRLNLIQLLLAWFIHLVVPWVYVAISPLCLPKQQGLAGGTSKRRNPFRESSAGRSK